MKNQYWVQFKQWCVVALWAMSMAMSARAQTVQPPVIQWQRVVEATNPITVDDFYSSRPTIVKNSRGGYSVVTGDRRLLLLTSAGNTVTDTLLTGVSANGETIPSLSTAGLAPTSDGGVVVGVLDSIGWSLQKRDASGTLVWTYRLLPGPINQSYRLICVVASPDGGFVSFGVRSRQIQGGNSTSTIAQKLDKDGVPVWNTSIRFSDRLNSFVRQAISTTDGGYLMVGNVFDILNTASFGWAARLDEQGNAIWQKGYTERGVLRGVVLNPYFSGSFIASATDNSTGDVSQTLNIGPNGDLSTGYSQPGPAPVINSESRIVAGAARNGAPAFHTMLDAVNQNGGDFRLTNLAKSDQLVWTKTFGGSGNDVPQDIIITEDGGYLLVGTTTSTDGHVQGKVGSQVATWIVKLQNPANTFSLTQPTYNCQTGYITLHTSGGDGSPITYVTPGISRYSAMSNIGFIERELLNDPKPIIIQAIQSGYTTSYVFDLATNCGNPPPDSYPSPTLLSPIPNQTRVVGQQIITNIIPVSSYFRGPGATKSFRPIIRFTAKGLPDGMILFDESNESRTFAYIGGTPTTTGSYTVTVSAFVSNISSIPTIITFIINIIDPPTIGGTLTLIQPTYNCLTGLITFNYTGGDGAVIRYAAPGITLSSEFSDFGTVESSLRDNPRPITITATQSGYTTIYTFDFGPYCGNSQPPITPPVSNTFTLLAPIYNCQTGAIVFVSTGGDGSPITYSAPGITRANVTDNFGTIEPGLRSDPKPITITATQSGQSLSFTFDFGAYCTAQPPVNPPVTNSLTLLAPTYDCGSGAFTFKSSGGNGSPIEYMAIGITAWTTNPNQFVDRESRTANDVKPFTLMARQSGQIVTYVWDLKAACGRASSRLQATQTDNPLRLTVLGNPVQEHLRVRIQGGSGQPVLLQLTDLTGRSIESRTISVMDDTQEQVFELRQQGAGLLLLRASNGTQQRTLKVVKQ